MGKCGGDLLGKYGLSEHLGSGVGQVHCEVLGMLPPASDIFPVQPDIGCGLGKEEEGLGREQGDAFVC